MTGAGERGLAPRLAVLGLCAVVCAAGLVAQYASSFGSAGRQCLDHVPDGAAIAEDALVRAARTVLPLGRECVWRAASGGTFVEHTGWPVTVGVLVATAVCIAVGVSSALGTRRAERARVRVSVASMSFLLPLLTWTVAFAASDR